MASLRLCLCALLGILAAFNVAAQRKSGPDFGTKIGSMRNYARGVSGDVFAVDDDSIFIKGFRYDGDVSADAYFWGGNTPMPTAQGFKIPNENGKLDPLSRYEGRDIAIHLPPGKKLRDITYFAVWSIKSGSNFGDVMIPPNFQIPRPQKLSQLRGGSGRGNLRSGDVMVLDSKTILIPQMNYDGSLQELNGTTSNDTCKSCNKKLIKHDCTWVYVPIPQYICRSAHPEETFFVAGTGTPSSQGTKLPDENGRIQNLRAYNNEDVRLVLPQDMSVKDIDWLSVWNYVSNENLGFINIPPNLSVPPQVPGTNPSGSGYGPFSSSNQYGSSGQGGQYGTSGQQGGQYGTSGQQGGQYGTSGQQGGQYGTSGQQGGQYGTSGQQGGQYGTSGQQGGQYGTSGQGGQYGTSGQGGQYGTSGQGTQYGQGGQYGTSGQGGQYGGSGTQYGSSGQGGQYGGSGTQYGGSGGGQYGSGSTQYGSGVDNFTTCEEFLNGKVQVSWKINGDNILIRMAGQLRDNEYMAFGVSGSQTGTQMINGDVIVVMQEGFNVVAKDYYLDSKSKCYGTSGVCQDITLGGQNDLRIISTLRQNGITVATVERRLNTGDRFDKPILGFGETYVIAAYGPVSNSEIEHHTEKTTGNERIDFSREGIRNCRNSLASQVSGGGLGGQYGGQGGQYGGQSGQGGQYGGQGSQYGGSGTQYGQGGQYGGGGQYGQSTQYGSGTYGGGQGGQGAYGSPGFGGPGGNAWFIQPIERTFDIRCQIGPSGGDRGYSAITGKQTWGQVWWCNERLAPEIIVQRGQTYTFTVEGGEDPTNPTKYNPFYITDSDVGGYGELTAEERNRERIYGGVTTDYRGVKVPSAAGRYCEWRARTFEGNTPNTFEEYKQSLELSCDEGNIPARLVWVPDDGMPDTLYYQSYRHKNFGWRIRLQGRAGFRNGASDTKVGSSLTLLTMFATLTAFFLLRQ